MLSTIKTEPLISKIIDHLSQLSTRKLRFEAVFFEKQVPLCIGSDSPAIRFTSLRSVPAPVP